jgi:nicotinamide-nucleotide amidase
MQKAVRAEIIAIGTEILLGEITDTNSVYLAKALRDIGIDLFFMTTVGDNETRIKDAITIAFNRADIVITCGGLGPTIDDMTRQGVALATDRELVFHQELLDQISSRFASFRSKMTENNKRQAYLPSDSIVIENPVGTAPSFLVEHEGKIIISLPGVPREMKFLMQEWVIPHLQQRYELGVIVPSVLKTAGIGESMLDEILGADILESSNPTVGLAAHHGIIDIRITAKASTRSIAEQMIEEMDTRIREKAGHYIFGKDQDTIEQVLAHHLQHAAQTLAFIEAGISTGMHEKLQHFAGAYELIIQHDAYADPTSFQMAHKEYTTLNLRELAERSAEDLRKSSGSSYAIALFSLPDVNENADIEYGTALAISHEKGISSRVYGFGAQSEVIQDWMSRWALANVWRISKEALGAQ